MMEMTKGDLCEFCEGKVEHRLIRAGFHQGESLQELEENIREVYQLMLEEEKDISEVVCYEQIE